jgi:hypothetical protein
MGLSPDGCVPVKHKCVRCLLPQLVLLAVQCFALVLQQALDRAVAGRSVKQTRAVEKMMRAWHPRTYVKRKCVHSQLGSWTSRESLPFVKPAH